MRYFFFLFVVFLAEISCYAAPLKVGAILDHPFIIKHDTEYSGIAVELWDAIAHGLNETYTLVEYPEEKTKEAFEALSRGDLDVLIGALSVTQDTLKHADFTLPFYADKIVPVVFHDSFQNLLTLFKMMFFSFGWIMGIFFVLYASYLYFLWYYERKHSLMIPDCCREGVSYLFWKHILIGRHTDDIPKTLPGKSLVFSKTILSYFILTLLSATLVSFLTVSLSSWSDPIQHVSDLEKRRMGAIADSRPFKMGSNLGFTIIPFASIKEGMRALREGEIDTFLSDFSLVDTYLKEVGRDKVNMSHFVLKQDLHAFATRPGNPLLRKINEQMVDLKKRRVPEKICKGYLEKGVRDCDL